MDIHGPGIQVHASVIYLLSNIHHLSHYNSYWRGKFYYGFDKSHPWWFTQPAVARSMIELPANAEKGLSQRFIWTFPKPTYAEFETLELVDPTFSSALDKHFVCIV